MVIFQFIQRLENTLCLFLADHNCIIKIAGSIVIIAGLIWTIISIYSHINNPDFERHRFYWTFFCQLYLDGTYEYGNSQENRPIPLKTGRLKIEERYMQSEKREWASIDKLYEFLRKSSDTRETNNIEENKITHRLSVILNRIGQAAITGTIPVFNILSISSLMILQDWEKCKTLINWRIQYGLKGGNDIIHYTRRYAVWIASLSALYLIKEWADNDIKKSQFVYMLEPITGIKISNNVSEEDEGEIKKDISCYLDNLYSGRQPDTDFIKMRSRDIIKTILEIQRIDKYILAPKTEKEVKKFLRRF